MNTYVKEVYQTIGMVFVDVISGKGNIDLQIDILHSHKKRLNALLMAGILESNLYEYCTELLEIVIKFLTL